MYPNSPYQAPQTDLTQQLELQQQPDPTPLPEAFPRVLPAIVGVGATITFGALLYLFLSSVVREVIARAVPNHETDSLNLLLESIDFWIYPWPFVLGIFLLSLVPEESGAKTPFKFAWMTFLGYSLWLIIVLFEKNPESIPPKVLWIAALFGLTHNLALYWGVLRLSHFCHDRQQQRWSLIAVILSFIEYLLAVFREFCSLFGTEYFSSNSEEEYRFYVRLFEWHYYIHWVVWIALLYFSSRALWRIIAHAEIEARKNTLSPPHAVSTEQAPNAD